MSQLSLALLACRVPRLQAQWATTTASVASTWLLSLPRQRHPRCWPEFPKMALTGRVFRRIEVQIRRRLRSLRAPDCQVVCASRFRHGADWDYRRPAGKLAGNARDRLAEALRDYREADVYSARPSRSSEPNHPGRNYSAPDSHAEHACVVLVQLSSALASDNTGMPAHELSVEAAWLTHTDLSAYQRPGRVHWAAVRGKKPSNTTWTPSGWCGGSTSTGGERHCSHRLSPRGGS